MLDNLYSFSKKSWHVKFFKWIYNVDPTKEFKSMCPYFWAYIFTILLLPIVLIVKLFGKAGTTFLNNCREYRTNKEKKVIKRLEERISLIDKLTEKECYELYYSKCYQKYKYDISVTCKDHDLLKDKLHNYEVNLVKLNKINKQLRDSKIKELKESKLFNFFGYVLAIAIILFIGYFGYKLISLIPFKEIDWIGSLKSIGIVVGSAGIAFGVIILLWKGIGLLIDYLRCKNLGVCKLCRLSIWTYIGKGFMGIYTILRIICNMVYNTYKKNCPLITWKE